MLEAASLLAQVGGGVTIEPAVEGGWLDVEFDRVVWERPVRVFTYIKAEEFLRRLSELRAYLHRLGRETRQGEVALEFDGRFWRIRNFDS